MPNIDPPWDKPQDTQHCPSCEELTRKLAAAEQRLIVEEAFLRRLLTIYDGPLSEDVRAFLSAPDSGEWVVVRRGKLELILDDWVRGNVAPTNEVFDAYEELRSALKPKGGRDGE